MKELQQIQTELKAPKNQYNKFGKYSYRSCEDILEALKPLLAKYGCTLTISDEIVMVGEYTYIKATATAKNSEDKAESVTAFARHATQQAGMADAQITGSTSSYARKYALNGLFCIDDTKDDDSTNDHGNGGNNEQPAGRYQQPQPKAISVPSYTEKNAGNDPANANVISVAQQKRLFAIGKGKGLSNEEMSFIIFNYAGVEHSAEITRNKYDDVCAEMEKAEPGNVIK